MVAQSLNEIQVNVFDFDLVLVPINENKNHWTLLIANMKTRRITYHDPLNLSDGKSHFDTLVTLLLADYERRHPDKRKSLLPNYIHVKPTGEKLQSNKYDCGVFLCRQVRLCVDKKWESGVSPKMMRKEITEEILNQELKK